MVDGLSQLLDRIREELDYNDAKGNAAFRLGVHDGLRFAEDAIVDLLRRHGYEHEPQPRDLDA
jgi:homospermidine synthase